MPLLRSEMAPRGDANQLLTMDAAISAVRQLVEVQMYICPECRYMAMFAPPTPLEELEARQAEERAITDPVKRFEYNFRDYPDEKLQRVVDGRDYTPEAKKAARSLLYRRKYGE